MRLPFLVSRFPTNLVGIHCSCTRHCIATSLDTAPQHPTNQVGIVGGYCTRCCVATVPATVPQPLCTRHCVSTTLGTVPQPLCTRCCTATSLATVPLYQVLYRYKPCYSPPAPLYKALCCHNPCYSPLCVPPTQLPPAAPSDPKRGCLCTALRCTLPAQHPPSIRLYQAVSGSDFPCIVAGQSANVAGDNLTGPGTCASPTCHCIDAASPTG